MKKAQTVSLMIEIKSTLPRLRLPWAWLTRTMPIAALEGLGSRFSFTVPSQEEMGGPEARGAELRPFWQRTRLTSDNWAAHARDHTNYEWNARPTQRSMSGV